MYDCKPKVPGGASEAGAICIPCRDSPKPATGLKTEQNQKLNLIDSFFN